MATSRSIAIVRRMLLLHSPTHPITTTTPSRTLTATAQSQLASTHQIENLCAIARDHKLHYLEDRLSALKQMSARRVESAQIVIAKLARMRQLTRQRFIHAIDSTHHFQHAKTVESLLGHPLCTHLKDATLRHTMQYSHAADFTLYVMDFLQEMKERYGDKYPSECVATHLINSLQTKLIPTEKQRDLFQLFRAHYREFEKVLSFLSFDDHLYELSKCHSKHFLEAVRLLSISRSDQYAKIIKQYQNINQPDIARMSMLAMLPYRYCHDVCLASPTPTI